MTSRRFFLGTLLGSAPFLFASQPGRIRVAQIGVEHPHAGGKLEALRHLSGLYEVVGVSAARNPLGAVYEGIPRMSEPELLSIPGLQAVTVETRVEEGCGSALRALRAGKHVHLDKPGALSHPEFRAMRLEAEQRGLCVQMGYMLRANPAFEWLFKAVRAGWIGEVLEIDAAMGKMADARTRSSIGALEGGGMFELACHVIDAVVTILGKPSEVVARSTPSRPDSVRDNQVALLVYPSATATIRCNHADPFGGEHRRFKVTGTRGAVEIRPLESGEFSVSLVDAAGGLRKGAQCVKLPLPRGRYDEEFVELARVIRGEKNYPWNAVHDVAVHETVLLAAGLSPH
jgi:predicted dehydrogenase